MLETPTTLLKTRSSSGIPWSVIISAQAQEVGLGSVFCNPILRKLIVCNYNGVCHPLNLSKLLDQRVLQKRDSWRRIPRSLGFDNGPPKLKSTQDIPRKGGLWYPIDIGERFRQFRLKIYVVKGCWENCRYKWVLNDLW